MSKIESLDSLPDISFIDNMTLAQCKEQMKTWWQEKYERIHGKTYELSDLDTDKLLLDTCAMQYYQALQYIDHTGKQNLLKYSTGNFLENFVADMRIFRSEGKRAKVTVRFQLSMEADAVYTIPAGTLCSSEDDVFFATIRDEEIQVGDSYIDIECECTEPGSDGNEYKVGDINSLVTPLTLVENIWNINESAGGTDPDSDDVLAEKRFLAPAGMNGWGGEPYYQFHMKNFDSSIGDIVAVSPRPCYTDITFIMRDGSLPSEEFIAQAQSYINEKCVREIGDIIRVNMPETFSFSVNMKYFINESDRKNAVSIQENVQQAVGDYVKWQCGKFGRDINPDELSFLVKKAGAKRCQILTPVFTTVEKAVIPAVADIHVEYGGIEDD